MILFLAGVATGAALAGLLYLGATVVDEELPAGGDDQNDDWF
ncbi:MAG: hypothetical protein RDU30_09735 [Desulfovibrionaceae bacterium]|nr:hypothetical protein [Desulfovibrionaceae bacterium]